MARGPALSIAIDEKRFGEAEPLFTHLRLEVAPSSLVALVGPSGVGKSTLLRMIAGIDTAFSGSVRVDGVAAAEAPPAGFVLQDARLLPWLTVADNISAVAPQVPPAEISQLLARVGLAGTERRYPHQLSGGMQRRVAVARAFSFNPRLLLLVEPFVSLDRQLVSELQSLLLELLAAEQPTAILVTHLAEDAARLADRTVVLGGKPAHIVADLNFATPPRQRDAAERLRLTAEIEAASAS